jgi:hypothetical protein
VFGRIGRIVAVARIRGADAGCRGPHRTASAASTTSPEAETSGCLASPRVASFAAFSRRSATLDADAAGFFDCAPPLIRLVFGCFVSQGKPNAETEAVALVAS